MTTIHGMVAEQTRRSPHATAVTAADATVTYAELDGWSDRVATTLTESGLTAGDTVAVAVRRSAAYVAAVLGVLKAGGAYVPLDQDYPPERQAHILADSGAAVMLGGDSPDSVPIPTWPAPPASAVALPEVTGSDVAYVMYTSGSTGAPKGVVVEHRQVTGLVCLDPRLHVAPGQRVAQLAPLAFDASTFEIWGALCHGGEVVVLPGGWDSVDELGRQLRATRPDWLFLTTGLFHLLAEYDLEAVDSVGTLITGGDVLSPKHVAAAAARGTARVYAAYGPTEATTFTSLHAAGALGADRVPIGSPLAGVRMSVLNDAGQPVPAGEIGELHIAGAGVARGYLNSPELTGTRFAADPRGGRRYRTGDLVRELPDGQFEFHGRVDRQVKIRGFRVEPGEIEHQLTAHPQVAAAVVAAVADATGRKRLVGYAVPVAGTDLRTKDLRGWVSDRLPAHLEPSSYLLLDAIPLDVNGKPDRAALPYPWSRRAELPGLPGYRQATGPVESVVAAVWAESLGLDQVGLDDDFYLLGGDSLHSVDVLARLRKEGLEVSALSFFQNPTVRELAAALSEPAPVGVSATTEEVVA